jgi:hypothetical protein
MLQGQWDQCEGVCAVCLFACVWQQMTVGIFASDQLSAQLQRNASLRPTAYMHLGYTADVTRPFVWISNMK